MRQPNRLWFLSLMYVFELFNDRPCKNIRGVRLRLLKSGVHFWVPIRLFHLWKELHRSYMNSMYFRRKISDLFFKRNNVLGRFLLAFVLRKRQIIVFNHDSSNKGSFTLSHTGTSDSWHPLLLHDHSRSLWEILVRVLNLLLCKPHPCRHAQSRCMHRGRCHLL